MERPKVCEVDGCPGDVEYLGVYYWYDSLQQRKFSRKMYVCKHHTYLVRHLARIAAIDGKE